MSMPVLVGAAVFRPIVLAMLVAIAPLELSRGQYTLIGDFLPTPRAFEVRACSAWSQRVDQTLEWQEKFGLLSMMQAEEIRDEAASLMRRCGIDAFHSVLGAFSTLMLRLYDDRADG